MLLRYKKVKKSTPLSDKITTSINVLNQVYLNP